MVTCLFPPFSPLIPGKVMDRNSWRAALENGNYELLNPESKENAVINGEEEPMELDENHVRVKDRLFHSNICYLCIFTSMFRCCCCRVCLRMGQLMVSYV